MSAVWGRLGVWSSRTRSQWLGDADLQQHDAQRSDKGLFALASLSFVALGVIYGDIGTSPLYVVSTIFNDKQPTAQDVLCAASLIFWSITLIVLVNYVLVILRADDHGEGGTLALYALITRSCGIPAINSATMPADQALFAASRRVDRQSVERRGGSYCRGAIQPTLPTALEGPTEEHKMSRAGAALKHGLGGHVVARRLLMLLTVIMTGMVLGDGVLTPCISVLSAVQGLQTKAGISQDAVVGITCGILALLFCLQQFGTQRVGSTFAPTILLFFGGNVLVAIYNIATFEGASIFRALSPHYIVIWFQNNGTVGWQKLAGVFLCLTGCEAMFADLGHFTRRAVWVSFTAVVYPSLALTYLGQASWLMHNLDGYSAVYYNSIPTPVFWPIFIVSVLASIVASQALITGSFSLIKQAMALGFFPRFKVHHTSKDVGGQVYIPAVNWTLLLLCIAVVAGFRDGTAIGNAYGIAVNMVMLGSIVLVSIVMLVVWGKSPLLVAAYCLPFAVIVGAFLSANLLNVAKGGWFSLAVATCLAAISCLYICGTSEKAKALHRVDFRLSDVMTYKRADGYADATLASEAGPSLSAPSPQLYRVSTQAPLPCNPGMALVYSESPFHVPAMYGRIVESWGVHSIVVFITVRQVPMPFVSEADRLLLAPLEYRGFYRCVARYGYMDRVDQGPTFAQSVLDKIALATPSAGVTEGFAPMPRATTATITAPAAPADNTTKSMNKDTALVGGTTNSSEGATATCTIIMPHERTEHTSVDFLPTSQHVAATPDGDAAAAAEAAAVAVQVVVTAAPPPVSDVASRAVYVLQRTIIRCVDGGQEGFGGRVRFVARKVVLEHAYQAMWQLSTRFWHGMDIPVSRMFEVGMLLEM